jgi:hypothetical protein
MLDLLPPITMSSTSPTLGIDLHYHGLLATVSKDGEVRINWKHVEETAADPKAESISILYAKMLLAARDGTAKPLSDDK